MLNKVPTRILIALVIVICFIYLIISVLYKPIISNDALNGFVSLHNYLNGCKWNKILGVGNDGAVYNKELTWWAPGQYELPYVFSKIFGNNIAIAISFLLFFSIVGGSYFYYKIFGLYSTLPKRIVLVSLLLLLLQRFININFIQYTSSDLFLFFYVPLYIWVYLKVEIPRKPLNWYNFLILLLINIGGLYIKNSFLLFSLALNAFLFVSIWTGLKGTIKSTIGKVKRSFILLPFAISVLLDYYFFLKLGVNPSSGAGIVVKFSSIIQGIFQALTGILFSSLSLTSMYGNLSGKVEPSASLLNLLMLGCSVLIISVLYFNRKNIKSLVQKDLFFFLTLVVSVMYTVYWLGFNIKQSYISNEDRLFLPVTILVLPYLIQYISSRRVITGGIFILAIAISILYGVGTMINRVRTYSSNKMSITSADPKLQSFKVFSEDGRELSKFSTISNLISTQYKNQYLIATDINVLFLLKINNQFILEPANVPPFTFPARKQYLLVVDVRNNPTLLSGWTNIYKSDSYNLYLY